MLPFLAVLSDGLAHHIRDIGQALVSRFKLTGQELEERIPSGGSTIFDNRVSVSNRLRMSDGT
jgi:restriction endonuclease Mrr